MHTWISSSLAVVRERICHSLVYKECTPLPPHWFHCCVRALQPQPASRFIHMLDFTPMTLAIFTVLKPTTQTHVEGCCSILSMFPFFHLVNPTDHRQDIQIINPVHVLSCYTSPLVTLDTNKSWMLWVSGLVLLFFIAILCMIWGFTWISLIMLSSLNWHNNAATIKLLHKIQRFQFLYGDNYSIVHMWVGEKIYLKEYCGKTSKSHLNGINELVLL